MGDIIGKQTRRRWLRDATALPPERQGSDPMSAISSLECQKRAAHCRSLTTEADLSLKGAILLARLADGWEALAIEVEMSKTALGDFAAART